MSLDWFNAREATAVGAALADQLAPQALPGSSGHDKQLQELMRRADREVGSLRLNFYKRAKLANSFKWRLLEKGVEKKFADEVTQALVMHLMAAPNGASAPEALAPPAEGTARSGNAKQLLTKGNACFARGEYAQAMAFYQDMVELKPRSPEAHNNLGAALYKLEQFGPAEERFRQAIKLRPDYPEALCNRGAVLQWQGYFVEAEASLRRALKLQPNYVDARSLLGKALVLQGRGAEAKSQFEKVLANSPNDMEALLGAGQVAAMEGQFEGAESWFRRALEQQESPRICSALAALAGLRRMTPADADWLKRAQRLVDSGVPATEEAALRFAIGKYYDDLGNYTRAFQSYQRGNEISKGLSIEFQPDVRTQFVDDLIRAWTSEKLTGPYQGASDSNRPVFVVGMPRSGTTLAEQIIASHPAVKGAGELEFWNLACHRLDAEIRSGLLAEPIRKKLAEDYLRVLSRQSADAQRVLDKAPVNSDYLGVIHSVMPRARIIYMRRNAIDTCLSCYFQPFAQPLNFTMDLSDLEHYYRQHHRLMAHWRAVLPPGTMLEVPYEGLVADQLGWTRRMLDFIGLEWDDRCADFHETQRGVATASSWQVRQKIYGSSVERWRNYEKFIGPLMSLRKLDA
jgi:tetratricopeptide (TPR) repeat protein